MAKRYIKLTGTEIATPENKNRGDAFLQWFAQNRSEVIRCINVEVDEDLLTDAMLRMYDSIALKGFKVDTFKSYYLMTYRNVFLAAKRNLRPEDIEGIAVIDAEIIAPPFDEKDLCDELIAFVRGNYDTISVSIFEIYVSLYPQFSSLRIAELTGLPISRIKTTLAAIRKDVCNEYGSAYTSLLSLCD